MSIWDDYPITEILEAIKQLKQAISWKPGKASTHLLKRIRLGHLPSEATLEQYESIIHVVLKNPQAELYIFVYETIIYHFLSPSNFHDFRGGITRLSILENLENTVIACNDFYL